MPPVADRSKTPEQLMAELVDSLLSVSEVQRSLASYWQRARSGIGWLLRVSSSGSAIAAAFTAVLIVDSIITPASLLEKQVLLTNELAGPVIDVAMNTVCFGLAPSLIYRRKPISPEVIALRMLLEKALQQLSDSDARNSWAACRARHLLDCTWLSQVTLPRSRYEQLSILENALDLIEKNVSPPEYRSLTPYLEALIDSIEKNKELLLMKPYVPGQHDSREAAKPASLIAEVYVCSLLESIAPDSEIKCSYRGETRFTECDIEPDAVIELSNGEVLIEVKLTTNAEHIKDLEVQGIRETLYYMMVRENSLGLTVLVTHPALTDQALRKLERIKNCIRRKEPRIEAVVLNGKDVDGDRCVLRSAVSKIV